MTHPGLLIKVPILSLLNLITSAVLMWLVQSIVGTEEKTKKQIGFSSIWN